jgi:hypothetical protein
MILVEFSNLTFDFGGDMKRVSNVKFIPLEPSVPEHFPCSGTGSSSILPSASDMKGSSAA